MIRENSAAVLFFLSSLRKNEEIGFIVHESRLIGFREKYMELTLCHPSSDYARKFVSHGTVSLSVSLAPLINRRVKSSKLHTTIARAKKKPRARLICKARKRDCEV